VIGAVLITRLHGRIDGMRVALGALAALVLYSLLR
jgi:hypothetical protein